VSENKTRYAAYDLDALRFVGEVHDTKAAAEKAAKDHAKARELDADQVEVREV
jgi:hypothetical protein